MLGTGCIAPRHFWAHAHRLDPTLEALELELLSQSEPQTLPQSAEEVLRGDTIALSGDTGFVPQPLLHFDVVDCMADCGNFQSIPAGFMNAQPPVDAEMVEYLAVPF